MSVIGWLLDGDPAIRWPVLARPATAPDRPGGPLSRQARGPVRLPAEEQVAAPGPARG